MIPLLHETSGREAYAAILKESDVPEAAIEPDHDKRYYFHHRSDDDYIRDEEGACFASAEDAMAEAIRCAREMISERLLSDGAVAWDTIFDIEDEDGLVSSVTFLEAAGFTPLP